MPVRIIRHKFLPNIVFPTYRQPAVADQKWNFKNCSRPKGAALLRFQLHYRQQFRFRPVPFSLSPNFASHKLDCSPAIPVVRDSPMCFVHHFHTSTPAQSSHQGRDSNSSADSERNNAKKELENEAGSEVHHSGSGFMERMDEKRHVLMDRMEEKRHELTDRMEEKRHEIADRMEEKRHELADRMEEKKVELSEMADTKRIELRVNIFNRFLRYLINYRTTLKSLFPDKLVKTYRIVRSGTSSIFSDMKTYSTVDHLLSNTSSRQKAYNCLSRREFEVYLRLPKDLVRVAPALLVSALPLAQNVVFPLALLYPRTFLSTHFWTNQQLEESYRDDCKERHRHFPILLHHLKFVSTSLRKEDLFPRYKNILSAVDSSERPLPSAADLLEIKSLFSGNGGKLGLNQLSRAHARTLCRVHLLSLPGRYLWPRRSLEVYGSLFLGLDRAVEREGIHLLDQDTVQRLSYQRGLKAHNCDTEKQRDFLVIWSSVSTNITEEYVSLLLHLPLLLASERSF